MCAQKLLTASVISYEIGVFVEVVRGLERLLLGLYVVESLAIVDDAL